MWYNKYMVRDSFVKGVNMKKYYVSGMFIYGEVVQADGFKEAADIFTETNNLNSYADIDGEVAVTDMETDEMEVW